MMESFNIMYSDLNETAQAEYLKFQGVDDVSDLNTEIEPLAILDREVEFEPIPTCYGNRDEWAHIHGATCLECVYHTECVNRIMNT